MRLTRDDLVFKALCVLDEALEQSNAGAVAPTAGLRFALAFLYAVSRGHSEWFDREPYDEFWRHATGSDLHDGSAAAFGRSQHMNAAFNGIARAAGMERDEPLMRAMEKARGKAP